MDSGSLLILLPDRSRHLKCFVYVSSKRSLSNLAECKCKTLKEFVLGSTFQLTVLTNGSSRDIKVRTWGEAFNHLGISISESPDIDE